MFLDGMYKWSPLPPSQTYLVRQGVQPHEGFVRLFDLAELQVGGVPLDLVLGHDFPDQPLLRFEETAT